MRIVGCSATKHYATSATLLFRVRTPGGNEQCLQKNRDREETYEISD